MRRISRPLLVGALVMIFLTSTCGAFSGVSPTPVWSPTPQGQIQLPTSIASAVTTPTGISVTPLIPITGENVVSMQCQFCVDDQAHAILIFPDFAFFDVNASTPVSCLTADVESGMRIVICRGTQSTSFTLNICSDSSNCLQFPVTLQPCPLLQAGTSAVTATPFAPVFLTPINTLKAPIKRPTQSANTSVPITPTPTLPVLSTPTISPPTSGPQPTDTPQPKPTIQPPTQPPPTNPPPTNEPPGKPPTHTPKPKQNLNKTPPGP